MLELWLSNISVNKVSVNSNKGPRFVVVVSGSEISQRYWKEHLRSTCSDVFRRDGTSEIVSVLERNRKGNFLGTLNAWDLTNKGDFISKSGCPDVSFMSMVFGKGKRLSPFTQALGNRKSAFLVPMRSSIPNKFLTTADVSNLYANNWIHYLRDSGFRGLLVKWGDEIIIPGKAWSPGQNDYREVDAIRCIWKTKVTETLAREKEWIISDKSTGLMSYQCPRKDLHSLEKRLEKYDRKNYDISVNLGSFAVSYDFLNIAIQELNKEISDPNQWVDWDPYVWIALCCKDETDWRNEAEFEKTNGLDGIEKLESRFPNFYFRINQLRKALELKNGRPLAIGTLDFGDAFWIDLGLHITIRKNLESMTLDSDRGKALREIFGIPHDRDENGNIILRSRIPKSADIKNSIIVDSFISDPKSILHNGIIVGSKIQRLCMPQGGCALFCNCKLIEFLGPHGIAYQTIGSNISIPEGGRYTTIQFPDGKKDMVSNEAILDYSSKNYSEPILSNLISFEKAGEIMSEIDGDELEKKILQTLDF